MDLCICFIFLINCFYLFRFSKALLDGSVSCHSYAKEIFKNNISAIKLFIVMIKNLYLKTHKRGGGAKFRFLCWLCFKM